MYNNRPPTLSRKDFGNPTLFDTRRLSAVKALAVLDTPAEAVFDRLTNLASKLIGAPVSLISLIDGNRHWVKSAVGLPEPWATRREAPMSHSICQHVVIQQKALVINDTREADFLKTNLAVSELKVISYLGTPLITAEGNIVGTVCVIDHQPRTWTAEQADVLKDIAATAMSLMEMRSQIVSMTTANESKARSAMTQLAQAEAHHKEETHFFKSVLRQVAQMIESQRPRTDILSFLKGIGV